MAHEINFVARDCHFVFYIHWTEINGKENITAQTGVIAFVRCSFLSMWVCGGAHDPRGSGYSVGYIWSATDQSHISVGNAPREAGWRKASRNVGREEHKRRRSLSLCYRVHGYRPAVRKSPVSVRKTLDLSGFTIETLSLLRPCAACICGFGMSLRNVCEVWEALFCFCFLSH